MAGNFFKTASSVSTSSYQSPYVLAYWPALSLQECFLVIGVLSYLSLHYIAMMRFINFFRIKRGPLRSRDYVFAFTIAPVMIIAVWPFRFLFRFIKNW